MGFHQHTTTIMRRPHSARTLRAILDHADNVDAIRRSELSWGDTVVVSTKNSVYALTAGASGKYFVRGGWFDQRRRSPMIVGINGCTWGGTTICEDIVAAPGLFLEFSNGVKTTRIRRVVIVRSEGKPCPN